MHFLISDCSMTSLNAVSALSVSPGKSLSRDPASYNTALPHKMSSVFTWKLRSRLSSTRISPSRENIFPYEHIFPARWRNLFCLWLIHWRQRQSPIVLYPSLPGNFFSYDGSRNTAPADRRSWWNVDLLLVHLCVIRKREGNYKKKTK